MTLQTFAHSFAKKFAAWDTMYQAGMFGRSTEFCKISHLSIQRILKTDLKHILYPQWESWGVAALLEV